MQTSRRFFEPETENINRIEDIALPADQLGCGELHIPLARGRISWVRRTDERGTLAVLGRRLPLGPAAANEYAVATLSTARGDIAVRLAGGAVKIFRFPITERVVQPLRRGDR